MKMSRLRACFVAGAALSASACSGDDRSDRTDVALERPSASRVDAAPAPLTAELNEQIWANLFGGFARGSEVEVSAEDREVISVALEELGIAREDVSFVGANVFVQDISFDARAMLEQLHSDVVAKGKVLSQVINQIIGTHDTSLVSPSDVVGAPVQYARESVDGAFSFNRPEVDAAFAHVLVLADGVPAAILAAFQSSVAEIGNASEEDCLSPTFLQVLTRSEFDAAFPRGPFDVPPRVTEVFYSPEACGGRSLGCTQFPRGENVVLSPASLDGHIGTFQHRVLIGGYIGINSAFITPESEEFSTITHEILHAMGVAHPVVERFQGAVAAKLVVPGTEPGDVNYPSIMAFRTTANRTFNLSPDDIETIATLYSSAPGCQYSAQPISVAALESDAGAPGQED